MRRRFQIGGGVNPSLVINKGIYIQHVDGGLYTKQECIRNITLTPAIV